MNKTFDSIGIYFKENQSCNTCMNNYCSANARHKESGDDYLIYITTDDQRSSFEVIASLTSNTSSDDDIEKTFNLESDTVQFIIETFDWDKCA